MGMGFVLKVNFGGYGARGSFNKFSVLLIVPAFTAAVQPSYYQSAHVSAVCLVSFCCTATTAAPLCDAITVLYQ